MDGNLKQKILKVALPLAIAISCSIMAVLLWQLPFFHTLEQKTVDWRIRFRAPDKSFGEKVLVILLDEAVMEQFPCRSPVPRGMLARLIQITSASGAGLIGLDIFLKNPTSGDEDRELSLAIKKSGRVVLVSALREKDGGLRLDMPSDRFLDAALATGLAVLPINPMDQRVRELQAYQKVGGQDCPCPLNRPVPHRTWGGDPAI
jgi:CHASE2 domain-containing sensor protein